jgi:hypothetical protein
MLINFLRDCFMPTFYQPQILQNALESQGLTMNFSNEGSVPLKCLFKICAPLPALTSYTSADFPDADPSTFGCWIPVVGSQNDLNSSYAQVETGAFRRFLFFKTSGSSQVLYHTSDLATGFANGTKVPVEDEPTREITALNIGQATLKVQDNDGPVILVGVLDIGLPDRRNV